MLEALILRGLNRSIGTSHELHRFVCTLCARMDETTSVKSLVQIGGRSRMEDHGALEVQRGSLRTWLRRARARPAPTSVWHTTASHRAVIATPVRGCGLTTVQILAGRCDHVPVRRDPYTPAGDRRGATAAHPGCSQSFRRQRHGCAALHPVVVVGVAVVQHV